MPVQSQRAHPGSIAPQFHGNPGVGILVRFLHGLGIEELGEWVVGLFLYGLGAYPAPVGWGHPETGKVALY